MQGAWHSPGRPSCQPTLRHAFHWHSRASNPACEHAGPALLTPLSRATVSLASSVGCRYFLLNRCFTITGRPRKVPSHTRCAWVGGVHRRWQELCDWGQVGWRVS